MLFSSLSSTYEGIEGSALTLKEDIFHVPTDLDVFGAIEGFLSKMTTFICDFLPVCLSHNKTNGPFSVCILFFFKICPPYLVKKRCAAWITVISGKRSNMHKSLIQFYPLQRFRTSRHLSLLMYLEVNKRLKLNPCLIL